MNTEQLPAYYSNIAPSTRFLKEYFTRLRFNDLQNAVKSNAMFKRSAFDAFFLNEAMTFLRMSVINLLSYKFLMIGRYLAWGYVTLYYSEFYAISSLLRLSGVAVVHVDDLDSDRTQRFELRRTTNPPGYKMFSVRKREHEFIWNTFATEYKDWVDADAGKYRISERVRWNYELLFPSQSGEKHAKDEVKIVAENNFLDPNFGNFPNSEAAEYYADLRINYGSEEISAGELIRQCFKLLTDIADSSKYKDSYLNFFKSLMEHVDDFQTQHAFRETIKGWIQEAISRLNQGN